MINRLTALVITLFVITLICICKFPSSASAGTYNWFVCNKSDVFWPRRSCGSVSGRHYWWSRTAPVSWVLHPAGGWWNRFPAPPWGPCAPAPHGPSADSSAPARQCARCPETHPTLQPLLRVILNTRRTLGLIRQNQTFLPLQQSRPNHSGPNIFLFIFCIEM